MYRKRFIQKDVYVEIYSCALEEIMLFFSAMKYVRKDNSHISIPTVYTHALPY